VPYDVQTPVYEGPFDLLLHLIMREEVDIHEVTLADIVDAYLAELSKMEELDLDVATEFLLIAATLVEIKARSLLPGREGLDLDEEFALWEERDLLLARLLECKTFKDVSQVLAVFVEEAERSFPRTAGPDERFSGLMPDLMEGVDVARLQRAMVQAITPKPQPSISLFHVSPIRFTVAEVVQRLIVDLPDRGRVTFRSLTSDLVERLDVVVHFLALLELFKQGLIELAQTVRFGDIQVEWTGIGTGGVPGRDDDTRDGGGDVDEYEG